MTERLHDTFSELYRSKSHERHKPKRGEAIDLEGSDVDNAGTLNVEGAFLRRLLLYARRLGLRCRGSAALLQGGRQPLQAPPRRHRNPGWREQRLEYRR